MTAQPPRFTVSAALSLPVVRKGLPEVVAGSGGLDRAIRWVHAAEVPNIASLLRGGELLLTTGMGLADRAAGQRSFIAELDERGVAALVIELGGALTTLPRVLVDAAEARGLPLVVLHREVPFVTVTEAIHTQIVNHEYSLLRRGDEIHRELAELLLGGDDLTAVLQALAALLGNPVLLEDGEGRLLSHASPPAGSADAVAAWEGARRSSPGERWSGAVARPVPIGVRAPPGRLVVLPLETPLDELAEIAVERTAGIVALALLRSSQEDELRAHARDDLLADLADGRIGAADAAAQARAVGLRGGARLLLPLAVATPAARLSAPTLRDLGRALERLGLSALLGNGRRSGLLLAVVALPDAGARASRADAVAGALRAGLAGAGGAEPLVVAGRAVGWPELGGALALVADGAASASVLPPAPWHDMDSLELPRLFWRWRDDPELASMVWRALGPLIEHDRDHAHLLLPTLEALCAHGGRRAEAARSLHLNRPAIYRRVARIERLIGGDLADPGRLQLLALALIARRYLGVLPQADRLLERRD